MEGFAFSAGIDIYYQVQTIPISQKMMKTSPSPVKEDKTSKKKGTTFIIKYIHCYRSCVIVYWNDTRK